MFHIFGGVNLILIITFSSAMNHADFNIVDNISCANKKQWSGTWSGVLETYPSNSESEKTSVTWNIGTYPENVGDCSFWRTTYTKVETIVLIKTYQLCRANGSDIIFIDQDDGSKIVAQWFDAILVHPFRYNGVIAINIIQMHENQLEEDRITFDPIVSNTSTASMRANTIDRLVMRRLSPKVKEPLNN